MMNENLYSILRDRFPQDLSRPLLATESGRIYSYQDLESISARYAGFLLDTGLIPGDRVLTQADKTPESFLLCLACIRAGLIIVPINPASTPHEIAYILQDAQPKLAVCPPRLLPDYKGLRNQLQASFDLFTLNAKGTGTFTDGAQTASVATGALACAGSQTAALMYTSGTTGRPKGAEITHGNISSNGLALTWFWQWTSSDVLLHCLPLHHLHGLFVATIPTLLCGGQMLFHRRFLASRVTSSLPEATIFMGVPTYYSHLLDSPDLRSASCSNIRLFISGSAPLQGKTYRAFQKKTGFSIVERYGMTEAGGVCSNPIDKPRLEGSVGFPLPGVQVMIADEGGMEIPEGEMGEILIWGDNVFPGYWRKPEESSKSFTPSGYFRSGDLGRKLADGSFSIVGRSKDVVITGGLNVYPKELEQRLDRLEGVRESAVIGVPHPRYGEAVVAIVVPQSRTHQLTEEKILSLLKRDLASYKVPRRIFFSEQIPHNSLGKMQKNLLRKNPRYLQVFRPVKTRKS